MICIWVYYYILKLVNKYWLDIPCRKESSLRSLIIFKSIKCSWEQKFENYGYRDSSVLVSTAELGLWYQENCWSLEIYKQIQDDYLMGMLKSGFKCCTGSLDQLLAVVSSNMRFYNSVLEGTKGSLLSILWLLTWNMNNTKCTFIYLSIKQYEHVSGQISICPWLHGPHVSTIYPTFRRWVFNFAYCVLFKNLLHLSLPRLSNHIAQYTHSEEYGHSPYFQKISLWPNGWVNNEANKDSADRNSEGK